MTHRILLAFVVVASTLLFGTGCGPRTQPLTWDLSPDVRPYIFEWNDSDEPYLRQLRTEYNLDSLTFGLATDLEKAQAICHWVNSRWEHFGGNAPQRNDPLIILSKAQEGQRFSCLEYASVTMGCLNSIGIKSRVISLMPEDVETRRIGPCHVIVESWFNDLNKWVMIDPTRDVIPMLGDKPLNSIQLQIALTQKQRGLTISTKSEISDQDYFEYVTPYLYYFEILFDNRIVNTEKTPRHKGAVLLVPQGKKWPRYFNGIPMRGEQYTSSLPSLFQRPE